MSGRGVHSLERRQNMRFPGAYPVRVRGVDSFGRAFEVTSLVDNMSSGGLYLQLPRSVGKGARLFALVRLTGGLTIAARGRVLREESRGYGLLGMAVGFTSARVLRSWGT